MFRQATGTIDAKHRGFFAAAGDARQVWARRAGETGNSVVFLPEDGVTDAVREDCRAGRLVCPMDDCPDPRFVARGGQQRRHHFAHQVAHVKHARGAVWRLEAMTMLAERLARYRGANVQAADGDPVATVAVRSERTGREVQLQVTYDRRLEPPLEQLRDRSQQLLVGHTRGLLLPRLPCRQIPGAWWCGAGRLVAELVLWRDVALAVNPEHRLVATLVDATVARRVGLLPRTAWTPHPLLCLPTQLDACWLTEHGLTTREAQRVLTTLDKRAQPPVFPPPEPPARAPSSVATPRPVAAPPPVAVPVGDPRQAEYLRRADGLDTDARLALLKEMFLPRPPASGGGAGQRDRR